MCFEHIGVLKTEPDGALAHERIQFIARIHRARYLVAAEIERPDDEWMGPHLFRYFAISRILFLFARECGAIEVKEFCPVKTDSLRSITRRSFHVVGQFDVGRKDDVPAIPGGRFGLAQPGQLLGDPPFSLF